MAEDRAAYLRAVESAFVRLRGSGWMLSPKDVARVEQWRQRGLPVRVVLRVLEDGMERYRASRPPDAPPPGSLGYFEAAMREAHIARRERLVSGSVGGDSVAGSEPTDDGLDTLLTAIADAGRTLDDLGAVQVLRGVYRTVRDASRRGDDPWTTASEADQAMIDGLAEVAGDALRRRAEEEAASGGSAAMSAAARADHARNVLERYVRARYGVPDLVDVLSDG